MKRGIFILSVLALTACKELIGERGNEDRVTKSITIDRFEKVEISGNFKITLTPSEDNELAIEADENLHQYIDVYVRGNTLYILTDRRLNSRKGIIIDIPVMELRRITSSGVSTIESKGLIKSADLEIEISGAGKLDLNLDVKEVTLDLSGATLVYLEGIAEKLDVDMSGAGSLSAGEFKVQDCIVNISGVGHVLVNVTGMLDAQVSGLGKVEYVGDPKSIRGDVSGIGKVGKAKD